MNKVGKIRRKTDREHALLRPARYIGAVKPITETRYILINNKLVRKEVELNPGFLKIFEEILDNSVDIAIKYSFKKGNKIKIDIFDKYFIIKDNGVGIPIEKNEDKEYYPFVAWNYLKSGSNFEESDGKRISMGTHGEGAALTNYFSSMFIAEVQDGKKYYKGVWSNNAKDYKEIVKSKTSRVTGVTLEVHPDFKRFNKSRFTDNDKILIKTRIAMLSMLYPEITFTLNKEVVRFTPEEII